MKTVIFTVLFFLFGTSSAVEALPADNLIKLIQQGGYVLYFRHAATDHSEKDIDRKNLKNCDTQRNLSELGKRQAVAIGAGFKEKNIPVGKILASPWCRTRHTAQLAFGRANLNSDLGFSISLSREDTQHLKNALEIMLTTTPDDGVNTVLVSHTSNLKETTGIWPKPEGAIAVFRPDAEEKLGYKYFGMIEPNYWFGLAAD